MTVRKTTPEKNEWWQKTTIYQIYPRSFMDSNNDGIGDIPGIINRLDYIQDLGFETIWLSPFYTGPQRDHGYDISDYYAIDPLYGTMTDVKRLIEEVHGRGMRIVFDMVLNHTSDEHPWFRESRSSRNNSRRNWYIWKKGKGKKPPTNWKSMVGNNGWIYDATTDEWYFSNFLSFQPDLNYANSEVKEAMFAVVRFWLDKGVDGFRLDIFNSIYKDEEFRDNPFSFRLVPTADNPLDAHFQSRKFNFNHPKNFELARELRTLVDTYGEKFLLGEVSGNDSIIKQFLGDQYNGLNLIFLFELVQFRFNADFFRNIIRTFETQYPHPYIPTYVYGNHDVRRSISRIGNDMRKARLLALFQLTARGVPVTYYGEEIGMADVAIPLKEAECPIGKQYRNFPEFIANALGAYINRDRGRTPMQWDDVEGAGFTAAGIKPWLPFAADFRMKNVKLQDQDDNSLLNTYRKLLRLRKNNPVLQEGSMELVDAGRQGNALLIYQRKFNDDVIAVVINFGNSNIDYVNKTGCAKILFSTHALQLKTSSSIPLKPYMGLILGQ